MMESNRQYFERRAEQEREAAETAASEAAQSLHRTLADRYRALLDSEPSEAGD